MPPRIATYADPEASQALLEQRDRNMFIMDLTSELPWIKPLHVDVGRALTIEAGGDFCADTTALEVPVVCHRIWSDLAKFVGPNFSEADATTTASLLGTFATFAGAVSGVGLGLVADRMKKMVGVNVVLTGTGAKVRVAFAVGSVSYYPAVQCTSG